MNVVQAFIPQGTPVYCLRTQTALYSLTIFAAGLQVKSVIVTFPMVTYHINVYCSWISYIL